MDYCNDFEIMGRIGFLGPLHFDGCLGCARRQGGYPRLHMMRLDEERKCVNHLPAKPAPTDRKD